MKNERVSGKGDKKWRLSKGSRLKNNMFSYLLHFFFLTIIVAVATPPPASRRVNIRGILPVSPVCGDFVLSLVAVAVAVAVAFLFTVNVAVAVPLSETIPSVCSPTESVET